MRRLLFLPTCVLFASSLSGQTVVVDWVGKNIESSPAKINKKTQAKIQVKNVNDVLYIYSIQLTGTPRADDDFANIAKAFATTKASGEAALEGCPDDVISRVTTASTDLGTSLSTFYQLPEKQSSSCSETKPCSVNIKDTRSAWKATVRPKIDAATKALNDVNLIPICKNNFRGSIDTLQAALNSVLETETYLNSDTHIVSTDATLEPDVDYAVEVKELYSGKGSSIGTQTNAPTLSVKFSPSTDQLTLSAGALFSEIQNRGYSSQSSPAQTGGGTQNVLSVSGLSRFSPLAVALLNYQIPQIGKLSFGGDNYGLAISTGPALRLGSQSNTSSFGYFIGLGVHIYHRLYISPGIHIGQFADFPPGFSKPGQPIPAGLGTPTPVNRTTARFAIAITVKAKDFSSLGLTASTKTTPSVNSTQTKPGSDADKPKNSEHTQ